MNYTNIPNGLLETLFSSDLNASELKVILFIIRYTYGFHREFARLTVTFIANGTGLSIPTVKRALAILKKNNLAGISSNTEGYQVRYVKGINSDLKSVSIPIPKKIKNNKIKNKKGAHALKSEETETNEQLLHGSDAEAIQSEKSGVKRKIYEM